MELINMKKLKENIDYINLDVELIDPDEMFAVYYYKGEKTNIAISTEGRIYDLDNQEFKSKRVLKSRSRSTYYGVSGIKYSGEKITRPIHRLVAETFLDGYDESNGVTTVDHIYGTNWGDNIRNLEWVTSSENARRSAEWGWQYTKGAEHYNSYTEDQIRKACEMKEKNISHKVISETTGINYNYLGKVFNGLKWADVVKDYNLNNFHKNPVELKERALYLTENTDLSNKEITKILEEEFNKTLNKNYVKDVRRYKRRKAERDAKAANNK